MVRRKDSELYKLILSLANQVVEGVQGGGVTDIPKVSRITPRMIQRMIRGSQPLKMWRIT